MRLQAQAKVEQREVQAPSCCYEMVALNFLIGLREIHEGAGRFKPSGNRALRGKRLAPEPLAHAIALGPREDAAQRT